MGQKSWAVTLVPLAVYLLSFAYSIATGNDFTPAQNEMLTTIFYGFLGSAGVGGAVSIANKLKH